MKHVLIATVGRPASGKTFWAESLVRGYPVGRIGRVNRDLLRLMSHGGYLGCRAQEEQVTTAQLAIVRAYLEERDVVVDDTNLLGIESVDRWLGIARSAGSSLAITDFLDVPPEVCRARNAAREPGADQVPESEMNRLWSRFKRGMFLGDPCYDDRPDREAIDAFRKYVTSLDISLMVME